MKQEFEMKLSFKTKQLKKFKQSFIDNIDNSIRKKFQ